MRITESHLRRIIREQILLEIEKERAKDMMKNAVQRIEMSPQDREQAEKSLRVNFGNIESSDKTVLDKIIDKINKKKYEEALNLIDSIKI